jgi:putative oxidoreductase
MAALAGGSEFVGGLLTATGLASPVGPVALAGAMVVASTVHGDKGPMALKGGYELALTNVAAALALAATGPGRYSLDALRGRPVPKRLVALTVLGGAGLTAYCAAAVVRTRRDRNQAPLPAGSANGSGPAAAPPAPDAAVSTPSDPLDTTVTAS